MDEENRPFLVYWDHLEDLELKRRSGAISDDRHLMTLAFIERIGADAFLEEAKQVHSIREIGRFYGNELANEADLHSLLIKRTEETEVLRGSAWYSLGVPRYCIKPP